MFSRFDVCTIGAGTRDVFVRSTHFEREKDASAPDGFDARLPMGAKIAVDDVVFETGGGATNAAVTFQRFGLRTNCICRVGDDQNGREILDVLHQNKVKVRETQVGYKEKTSYSVIILAGTGQRSILAYRGAAAQLNPDLISWRKVKTKWIYLTSISEDLKKIKPIFAHAKKAGIKIAWNPGNGELHHGLTSLRQLIKQTDILIMNREEAAGLAEKAPRHLESVMKKLGPLPLTALVVTDGPHGAYYFDPKNKKLIFGDALPGRRINTTGAGDAFGSAFVAAFIKTDDLEQGLRAGMNNSLGVITHMGAKAGILKSYPLHKDLAKVRVRLL